MVGHVFVCFISVFNTWTTPYFELNALTLGCLLVCCFKAHDCVQTTVDKSQFAISVFDVVKLFSSCSTSESCLSVNSVM